MVRFVMKVLCEKNLIKIINEAKKSKRKRAHHLLHSSHLEKVQRIIIALLRNTYIQPHSHSSPHQWESFVVLKGSVRLVTFNNSGIVSFIKNLKQGDIIELKPKTIHTLLSLSEVSVVYEIKEGPFFEEDAKEIVAWAPDENSTESNEFLRKLYRVRVGANVSIVQ